METYLLDVMNALGRRGVPSTALVHDHERSWRGRSEHFGADGQGFDIRRSATLFRLFFTPFSPGFRGDLRRLVRDFCPDIIHVHLPNPSALWLLSLGAARDIPVVVHWHSDVITSSHGWLMKGLYGLYRPVERRLLRRAAAVIATSPSYLASSESLSEFPDKCRVVPLGLDAERLDTGPEPVRPASFPEGRMQVLAVGRLTYYKGFGYLLRASARVDGLDVHIVGQGELRRELKKLARQLKVEDRIHFHGALDDEALAQMFVACDVLCLPSIERTEAFGLVLLEAMRFARPVIVAAVRGSGMGWVVKDEVTGLQVPPQDVGALAGALERLRADPALGAALGAAGRERFDQAFSIDRSVDALLDVYREVLG